MDKLKLFFIPIIFIAFLPSCKEDPVIPVDCGFTSIDASTEVMGYTILEKIPGIWNGPVSSSTPLGSYPEWIVDFRPISPAHVAAKNELDRLNDIFMSFFIVKHDCQSKIAFRNGGGFAGLERNSYMIIDSVFQNSNLSYYRFSDPVSGGNRVYSDVIFKQDSMIIEVYTNKYNTLLAPVSHMLWKASLRDASAAEEAINLFDFPQKQLERDFSNTFNDLNEAVFYSAAQDPFPEEDQAYIGNTLINISITNPSNPDPNKKVLIIVSTEKLFNGFNFNINNLKYRSRYVLIEAGTQVSFEFDYMHPGNYYVNAIYDVNGDYNFSSGDYINANFDIPFTLTPEGIREVNLEINFEIP